MTRTRRSGIVMVVAALLATAVAAVVVEAAPPASAAPLNSCWSPDNGDPRISDLTLTPDAVDVTAAKQKVELRVTARDLGGPGKATGIARVQAQLNSLGFTQQITRTLTATGKDFRATFTLPRGARPGTWTLSWVSLTDRARNTVQVSSTQLAKAGFPTEVDVSGTADVTPPLLTELHLSQLTPIDATQSPFDLTITAKLPDDLSGTRRVLAGVLSGSLNKAEGFALKPVPGTTDTFSGTWHVGTHMGTSNWQISIDAWDAVGNHVTYTPSDLGSKSMPWLVSVQSNVDQAPPVLVSSHADARMVDVRHGVKKVTWTVHLTDVDSGVHSAGLVVYGPAAAFGHDLSLVSGDVHDGIWKASLVFEPCQGGNGPIAVKLGVYDDAANHLSVDLPTLHMKGVDRRPPAPRLVVPKGGVPPTGPVRVDFDETVNGVTPQSLRIFVGPPSLGVSVKGTLKCRDAKLKPTSCSHGTVRRVYFRPTKPFSDQVEFSVWTDPPGSLSITDLAGNPAWRWSSSFGPDE